MRVETLVDPQEIVPLYTDDVHRLYEDVVERAEHKLEVLPAEFFRQLARRLPGEVSLTVIRQQERIVAFAWGLMRGGTYHNLFIGVDYSLNTDTDLYFNTMLRAIDWALQKGASDIFVGQSADDFKARIGCYQRPRFIYLKPPNRLFQPIFRLIARFVFSAPPAPAQHDLFKPEAANDECRMTNV